MPSYARRPPTPALDELETLAREIFHLAQLGPLARAARCRKLDVVMRAALGMAGNESTVLAVASGLDLGLGRPFSHGEIGTRLNVSAARVNTACVRYRAWLNARDTTPNPDQRAVAVVPRSISVDEAVNSL